MPQNTGARIKDRRIALEMTLAELGDKVGVQASTVRKWETGYIKDMRSDKIKKLAVALGVTENYLMGWGESHNMKVDTIVSNEGVIGQTTAPITINNNNMPIGKEQAELNRIFEKLSVRGRMKLLSLAMDLETAEEEAGRR